MNTCCESLESSRLPQTLIKERRGTSLNGKDLHLNATKGQGRLPVDLCCICRFIETIPQSLDASAVTSLLACSTPFLVCSSSEQTSPLAVSLLASASRALIVSCQSMYRGSLCAPGEMQGSHFGLLKCVGIWACPYSTAVFYHDIHPIYID
jgi:hypothetical protein